MPHFADMRVEEFIEQAASNSPVPGGGAIAALAGALGASMASMAANFTVGKAKFAQHEELMRATLDALAPLTESLVDAIDKDAAAFSAISSAYKLSRDGEGALKKRKEAINQALTASMRVPLAVARQCLAAAELLPPLAEAGNPNLLSDVEVAGIMLEAAAKAARTNVLANSGQLEGDAARSAETEAEKAVGRVGELAAQTIAIIAQRRSVK